MPQVSKVAAFCPSQLSKIGKCPQAKSQKFANFIPYSSVLKEQISLQFLLVMATLQGIQDYFLFILSRFYHCYQQEDQSSPRIPPFLKTLYYFNE